MSWNAGPGRRIVADVGHSARSPVDPSLPLHQLLVDEIATKRREVGMVPRDDVVDLRLCVAAAWLEVFDEPAQDHQPLLVLSGNAHQALPSLDEGCVHARVVVGWPGAPGHCFTVAHENGGSADSCYLPPHSVVGVAWKFRECTGRYPSSWRRSPWRPVAL